MGYPTSLDEVSDDALLKEVIRRGHAVDAGRCAYCGYALDHSDYPKVGPSSGKEQSECLRGKYIGRDALLIAVARAAHAHNEVDSTLVVTFEMLRMVNVQRCDRWHSSGISDWTGADWSNAMVGEGGEAMEAAKAVIEFGIKFGIVANTIKKIRRHETGLGTSYNTPELRALLDKLGEEVADVVIYADLLSDHYGIDLGQAVVDKFNKVSIGNGFPERLGE